MSDKHPVPNPSASSNGPVRPEPIWPSLAALIAVGVLNWLLPNSLSAGPGWFIVVAVAALASVAAFVPRWHLQFGYAALVITTLALSFALVVLLRGLVLHRGLPSELLVAALAIWSMNILVFASWYWRLDAGGPHRRSRHQVYMGGAFLFPQLSLPPELRRQIKAHDWRPHFVDYLFLAFNTSTAFSPTDVPVLSAWAKLLMMVQSSISLATLAVVAARAVNIL